MTIQTKNMWKKHPLKKCVWTFFSGHYPWTTLTSTTILPQRWHCKGVQEIQRLLTVHMGPMLVYSVPLYTKVWEATCLAFEDGSVTSSPKTPWSGCLRSLFPSHCCDAVSTRRHKLLGGHMPKLQLTVPCEQWQSSRNKRETGGKSICWSLSLESPDIWKVSEKFIVKRTVLLLFSRE